MPDLIRRTMAGAFLGDGGHRTGGEQVIEYLVSASKGQAYEYGNSRVLLPRRI